MADDEKKSGISTTAIGTAIVVALVGAIVSILFVGRNTMEQIQAQNTANLPALTSRVGSLEDFVNSNRDSYFRIFDILTKADEDNLASCRRDNDALERRMFRLENQLKSQQE